MVTLIRFLLGFMLVFTSLFLVLLVLIQRGRGGGLTGALGGMGGQSAFGTKAGDIFTRITVGVAAFWIGLCILSINVLGTQQSLFSSDLGGAAPQAVAPETVNPPQAPTASPPPPAPAGAEAVPGVAAIPAAGGAPAAATPEAGLVLPATESPAAAPEEAPAAAKEAPPPAKADPAKADPAKAD